MKVMYFGAGEFWLTEAVYKRVKGVTQVIPGYMGGIVPYPTHELVATGTTGHAEVVKVSYDEQVTCADLLRIFFALHDPVLPNHAHFGVGSHYRKIIFYTEDGEGEANDPQNGADVGVIGRVIQKVQERMPEGVPVSTYIMSAQDFYPAHESHYDYYDTHPDDMYSLEVIRPQIESIGRQFPDRFLM